jgi:hypothetical protein
MPVKKTKEKTLKLVDLKRKRVENSRELSCEPAKKRTKNDEEKVESFKIADVTN